MGNDKTALVPMTLAEAKEMATTVAQSSLLPQALRSRPADVFVTLVAGHELGLAPMQALRSFHVINGRPVMTAELMVALCKRRGDVCRYFQLTESTPERASYVTHRAGDPEPTLMTWTIEQVKVAGLLTNPTWQKHPAAMLRARCSSSLARAVYPDLMLGVMEEDEAAEVARQERRAHRDLKPDNVVDVEATPVTDERAPAEAPPEPSLGGEERPREVEFPLDETPVVKFDDVQAVIAQIDALKGDSQKEQRRLVYAQVMGYVAVPGPRWNPGKAFERLDGAERAAALQRAKDKLAASKDDLPGDWGATGSGAPEQAERTPGEEG